MSQPADDLRCVAVLPAGGSGSRFGGTVPKQFVEVGGRELITWALSRFDASRFVTRIVVAVPSSEMDRARKIVASPHWQKPIRLVEGGANRQESVANALGQAEGAPLVAVHDAVRPLFSEQLLLALLEAARDSGGAIPGRPLTETIHRVSNGVIAESPRREEWIAAQTPQCFRVELLSECLHRARAEGFVGTDDASLLVRYGYPVRVLEGEERNIKVTRLSDIESVERALGAEEAK
ncbi:MAG: 2-C-methyl-D-erythritol 4-phosphate cytidylyltransferase [Thermoanaerobaculia bacterium]